MLARKWSLRRIEDGQQQGVLAFAQGNRPFLRIDEAPAATIKPPSAELVSAPLDVAGAQGVSILTAPQHGAEPGIQFADTERLGEVVVGTEFESDHTVNFIAGTTCQNNDRDARTGTRCGHGAVVDERRRQRFAIARHAPLIGSSEAV